MPGDPDTGLTSPAPIHRSGGSTDAERYLKTLGDRAFLSLWSHAGIYRDQGKSGQSGHGKEVCDLLVIFENHVIIFSDKDCQYPTSDKPLQNWSRWYRRAIEESARQVWGAERWIRSHPDKLFLDRACSQPFPITLPPPEKIRFHRILVAHGVSRWCRQELGGSGSLAIVPFIVGKMHYDPNAEFPPLYPFGVQPFVIGQIDPAKGYVHVFDDTSLEIVMQVRDTITDFVDYLTKKEALITSGRLLAAAGEEDLLAYYMKDVDDAGEHDFRLPEGPSVLTVTEGTWEHFTGSPERKAQLEADRISYLWDHLIEEFTRHFFDRTYHQCSHTTYADQEKLLRFFARESRVRRRFLAQAFVELIEKGMDADRTNRLIQSTRPGDPHYLFLTYKQQSSESHDLYRHRRYRLLEALAKVAKLMFPDAQEFVCLATEPGLTATFRSEDAMYMDVSHWTPENEAEARWLQEKTGFFTHFTQFNRSIVEYPIPVTPNKLFTARLTPAPRSRRNSPCPCGSGKKYKKCCGRNNN